MPIVGERKSSTQFARGYMKDSMAGLAKEFSDLTRNIVNESGYDMFNDVRPVMLNSSTNEAMKNFFIENSCDRSGLTAEEYNDHMEMMCEQFENDRSAILEYSAMSDFNPVIGMTFPLHKNILMNCIWDKGAIQKAVAREPKFTISMESRYLVTPEGEEIDMFLHQDKMHAAVKNTAPFKDVVITLPENETVDVFAEIMGTPAASIYDNLSIESHISAVLVETLIYPGETFIAEDGTESVWMDETGPVVKKVWKRIPPRKFVPGYGEFDRILNAGIDVTVVNTKGEQVQITGYLSGYTRKNKFCIACSNPAITKVKLTSRIDTSSAMLDTCSVQWKVRTDIVEIPNAYPINVPISPEEVKDISALYNVNQLTKVMSLFKTVLGNFKDEEILNSVNESFLNMPQANRLAECFDFAPRDGYMLDHVEWRHKTFMDNLDTWVTQLLYVLNDPNMTITVVGNADIIRKITPTEYTYQTPANIGPVALDFTKTVVTSDRRVYQFISSDKMRDNRNLIILLNPRNTDRIIYRVYDYQMYVSNEIRNAKNWALPAIHAFERFKFVEYQPVQGRIKILNPLGLRNYVANTDPIGVNRMNNYTMNYPDGYGADGTYVAENDIASKVVVPEKVDKVQP